LTRNCSPTTVNQVTQIGHQLTQITNQVRNLQSFPQTLARRGEWLP
jgi:conjugal transfer/entry exclusion protein